MRFEWCWNPKNRMGSRLPLKRAAKGKHMKQKLRALKKQVSDVLRINSNFIAENEALRRTPNRCRRTPCSRPEYLLIATE